MQLTRGGSYRRGSLVPVQMLVRAGSLAGNTQAASNPDFFIDPTHARRGQWPVAGGRHLVQQHADPWLWFPHSTKLLL